MIEAVELNRYPEMPPPATADPRVEEFVQETGREAAFLPKLSSQLRPVAQLAVRRLFGRKSPFQVTFSLTNRCNFRCEYCDIPLQHREEMTTGQWFQCIDEFTAGGMGRASVIGGEPLLREDAGEIIRYLKKLGVHAAMNTNGWFVKERIEDVRALDLVCVTLDGPVEIHDKQRHPESHRRAIEAIEILKSRGVPVVTMTVITPQGAERVDYVLEIARQYGHKAYFQLEHDRSCDVYAPVAPRIHDQGIAALARRLMQMKREGLPVGNSIPVLEMYVRDGRRIGGSCADCFAGSYYAYVMCDGTVAPCLLTQRQPEQQNGLKHGFLKAFQEMTAPEGPGCACVPVHEVNQMLAFNLRVLWSALELV
ncbi:MAG: radical SAM protein [Bdellovibrionota bacterium]